MNDDAQHTLQACHAWEKHRNLREAFGQDLSLPVVLDQILQDRVKWNILLEYCEKVMLRKEDKEREEEHLLEEKELRKLVDTGSSGVVWDTLEQDLCMP